MRSDIQQQGIALLSVLWVTTVLTILAGSLVASQRQSTDTTRQWLNQAQARYAAEAAVHLALYNLFTHQSQPGTKNTEEIEPVFYAGFQLTSTIYSEAGKADINKISDPLLRKLIHGVLENTQQADKLTDQILDWRDGDELVRLNGAERRDYLMAESNFLPTNQPFKNISELQRLMEMNPHIYLKLQPLLTTYSGQSNIDIAAAKPELIEAMGITTQQPHRFFNAASSRLLEISSSAERSGFSSTQLTSTIALQPGNIRDPFHILAWDYSIPGLTDMAANFLPQQGGRNATEN